MMPNISNLLLYDITSAKCQIQSENATISAGQNLPTQNTHFSGGHLALHTEQPQLRQDSTNFFASIGLRNMNDLMDLAAENGRQAALNATASYAKMGRQMGQIDKGVTIAQVYKQKFLQKSDTSLVVKNTEPIRFFYSPGEVSTQFTPTTVDINWDVGRAARRYSPAYFSFDVLQNASIEFTYLGGYQYFPESSGAKFSVLA